jgi:class 3 adenylate cyclase
VMEFVAGFDLRQLMRRGAPLPEKVALSIIADATRGLVSAHERAIIHRDIKPGNILLAYDQGEGESESGLESLTLENLKRFRVKLSDFGLARQLEQSESMQMTQADGFLGTPIYMSPEQFSSQVDLSPATDVYAIGITLFEMLAGKPPFKSADVMKLMDMHSKEHAPLLSTLNPEISEATGTIVQRALAKKAHDRYADAGQLLQDIERLLRGEATHIAVHPQLPKHDPSELFEETFQWQLKGSAEDLWPHVSNTERINAAVGVPSVVYDTRRDDRGRLRKYGEFRLAGLQIGWEEHPFEWVEGQRLGILREFQKGPFVWFLSIVELLPQAGGGTLLRHSVKIKPRGLVGRMVARLEVSIKGKRNLSRVYRRIDDSVTGSLGSAPTVDPFSDPRQLSGAKRRLLEARLDQVAGAGIEPDVVECIGSLLRDAPAQELARIRPLALARSFSLAAEPLIAGCLVATKQGLLDLNWDILCPTCRISSQVANTLQEIENHVRCEACDLDFDVDLANSVEMIFRANPEIRNADLGTYCIGGPEHSPHVVLQVRIEPGKRLELTPLLSEGQYLLRSSQLTYNHRLRALPGKGTSTTEIVLSPDREPKLASQIRAGRNLITITNDYDLEIIVRLERTLPTKDVLTAAQASAMPVFRELFPDESPRVGQLINVATVTLLSVDLLDTDHLYFDLGDANAYSVVQRFHFLLQQTARKNGGSLVKVSGTEVLFAFDTPLDVIRAVKELTEVIDREEGLDVRFCAAVHRGTALATSTDGHLDFFGATVHLVQRMLRLTGGGELMMTEAIAADPAVVSAIRDGNLVADVCDLAELSRNGMRCQRLRVV